MQVLEKILQEILQEIETEKIETDKFRGKTLQALAKQWNDGIDSAAEIIRSHMEDDRWIPVEMKDDEWASKTALPEEKQPVWVTIERAGGKREVKEALFKEKSFWNTKHITYDYIVKAWMPRFVPAPYQSKEGQNE